MSICNYTHENVVICAAIVYIFKVSADENRMQILNLLRNDVYLSVILRLF